MRRKVPRFGFSRREQRSTVPRSSPIMHCNKRLRAKEEMEGGMEREEVEREGGVGERLKRWREEGKEGVEERKEGRDR